MISEGKLGLDPKRLNIGLGPFGLEEGFESRAAELVKWSPWRSQGRADFICGERVSG